MTATFIRTAEVWLQSSDGLLLEFCNGAFGDARRFGALTQTMCFGRAEGLPGRAWDEGRPIMLGSVDEPYFQRSAAARAAGLSCAVALPFAAAGQPAAVLVLFCGHDADSAAALEVWRTETGTSDQLALVGGAYGPAGAAFAAASQLMHLAPGVGLPGEAWQRNEAVFIEELAAEPRRFLRAEQATQAGMQRGLAIPFTGPVPGEHHVVGFLAGPALPLAHRIERWKLDDAQARLVRSYAFSELHGRSTVVAAELALHATAERPSGAIATAWSRGFPVVNAHPAEEPGAVAAAATSAGAKGLVAIPVLAEGRVVEVVALYL